MFLLVALSGLAEEHQGEAYFLSEEGDIEAALRELFAAFTLRVSGHLGEERVVLDYPLEFTQTEVSGALIPRLWAYQKVQALEAQIARFGAQQELLDDILALGLDYRLVTRRTSLFAPDEGVEVNPEPRDERGSTTAVSEDRQTARWLGRDFVLQDDVWIDLAYQPGMPKESYTGAPGQPAELAAFAALGQAMLVVIEGRAYEVRQGARPRRPVLQQNAPNPFNLSTVISFHVPVALAGEEARLTWDARDEQGRAVATGVYVYRLEMGEEAVYRRMLLVR